mgnify:CR=1 FL=1
MSDFYIISVFLLVKLGIHGVKFMYPKFNIRLLNHVTANNNFRAFFLSLHKIYFIGLLLAYNYCTQNCNVFSIATANNILTTMRPSSVQNLTP